MVRARSLRGECCCTDMICKSYLEDSQDSDMDLQMDKSTPSKGLDKRSNRSLECSQNSGVWPRNRQDCQEAFRFASSHSLGPWLGLNVLSSTNRFEYRAILTRAHTKQDVNAFKYHITAKVILLKWLRWLISPALLINFAQPATAPNRTECTRLSSATDSQCPASLAERGS